MSRREKTPESILKKVNEQSKFIQITSDKLVIEYCEDLDACLDSIRDSLENPNSISDTLLENYILELANILYFTSSAQEDLGIKEDICKAIRQEVYSKARESAEGTVADKTAKAELLSQQETIVLSIYSRAYRKVKFRMDSGYEMLNSLKKIMNKRITEMELSNSRYINHIESNE